MTTTRGQARAPTVSATTRFPSPTRRLRRVEAEDHTVVLRLLAERRDDAVGERTRCTNRLHVLLRDLRPGGAERRPERSRPAQHGHLVAQHENLRLLRSATAGEQAQPVHRHSHNQVEQSKRHQPAIMPDRR
jgi:hypothetical protein